MRQSAFFVAVLVLMLGAGSARAQDIGAASDLISRARGTSGNGTPELTDADLAFIYSAGAGDSFLSDTTVMPLAAKKRLHDLIGDKKLTAEKRRDRVLEMIGGELTPGDIAYLKSIGYEAGPAPSQEIGIVSAHIHYYIHDPSLSPKERQEHVHDEMHSNDVWIEQARVDQQREEDEYRELARRQSQTRAGQLAESFLLRPVAVSALVLVFAALVLLPVLAAGAVARGIRDKTIVHPARRVAAVLCLAGAVVSLVLFYGGQSKMESFWALPVPLLITLAAFLWLEQIEKRHVISLASLAGAVLSFAAFFFVRVNVIEAVSGVTTIGSVLGGTFAALMPPYMKQGRLDVISRVLALGGCLFCLVFWAIMGMWDVASHI